MAWGCHAEINAPLGSWNVAMRPWSPTSNGGAMTLPPAACTFLARSSASSVPRYRVDRVGCRGIDPRRLVGDSSFGFCHRLPPHGSTKLTNLTSATSVVGETLFCHPSTGGDQLCVGDGLGPGSAGRRGG